MIASLALIAACSVPAADPVRFSSDVAPILVRKCLGCHKDGKAQGGLNMTTFALLKKGGKTAESDILVPGDPSASHLIATIRPDAEPRMPYKQPPLSDSEIATLESWVRQGATFDGPSDQSTPINTLVDPLRGLAKIPIKVPASDPVTSVAFSPDGKVLAAAVGRSVVLFDVVSAKVTATLADHPGPVSAVLFTPDGRRVVAAGGRPGQFGSVAVWDVATRSRLRESRGHADSILAAALAPDGKTLATSSYDRLIKIWDVDAGAETRTLKEHTDAVHAVAFSRDGRSLASGSADRTVKVWDVATGRKRASLSGASAEVYAVAFSPDGRSVFAGGVDRSIHSWGLDGDAATPGRSAFAHDSAVIRLVASPDGTTLISSGEDRAIKRWDLATLRPLSAWGDQPDWPMAIAIDSAGSTIAVGRYDGSISLVNAVSGAVRSTLRDKPAPPPKPSLVRNATLNPPSPRGGVRGAKIRVTLSGLGVGRSESVILPGSGISAAILPRQSPDADALDVELTIPADARVGVHRLLVRTPLGVPPAQPFAVTDSAEVASPEPDDDPAIARAAPFPCTLLGAIDTPGDVDHFRFDARAGEDLVFEMTALPLGSKLNGRMTILAPDGRVACESGEPAADPVLVFTASADGPYLLRVSDRDYGGSGNHFYRIRAGRLPVASGLTRLGIEAGHRAMVSSPGRNLVARDRGWSVDATAAKAGAVIDPTTDAITWIGPRSLVVADGPQARESDESHDLSAQLGTPGGATGAIDPPGDVDVFRFRAQKGHRLVVETFAMRIGSLADTAIEILDGEGKPVPRAVLRPVEESSVAFRDHPSSSRNLRMTRWDDFREGDHVLIGRELTRIAELPRNPDDDAVLWGTGVPRVPPGSRLALLDTTPEHHPLAQPIYKVEIHPPGATFPKGGTPPVTLFHRNDDGGPALGKDSRVTFDPPADGEYQVRVEDVRGMGGSGHGYHLVIREPRPDFRLSLGQDDVNIPRGGTAIVQVNAERIDGFDGPIDIAVEGLPPGISASASRIEAGAYAAFLGLSAGATAEASPPPSWTIRGTAEIPDERGEPKAEVRSFDPGGPEAGFLTVTPEPNLTVSARPGALATRPGERIEVTFAVARGPAFAGRVPIEVRNLPRGVRVLNIGLNGVLVTEAQVERAVFLYAEPWVEPTDRPIFAVASCEAAGTTHASAPILLKIAPPKYP